MAVELKDYQAAAIGRMKNGCILNGGVGSGKSITALYYYFKKFGGDPGVNYVKMKNPKDLYIITTPMKRDKLEWDKELSRFIMSTDPKYNYYDNKVIVDSWNNVKKYVNVYGAFFIFDEDRVTGYGAWVKAFFKISKKNEWIILSATPGDTWEQYIPVFIANGFYRTKKEFSDEHLIYSSFTKFPKVIGYRNVGKLIKHRREILINMDYDKKTIQHHEDIFVRYDISKYKEVMKNRWDPYKNEPIPQASVMCYILRRLVNEDNSRQLALMELLEDHPRAIIFYNFDYELEILRDICKGCQLPYGEWNGHKHDAIPDGKTWVYLVQYTAGCEGWNSTKTDTIIFYSQNYSYRVMIQAAGRIDRLTTPYTDLYYYHLKTRSGIDLAISNALARKRNFNEGKFVKW